MRQVGWFLGCVLCVSVTGALGAVLPTDLVNPDLLFADDFASGSACSWSGLVSTPSTCSNGLQDGCETGIDCGGNECNACGGKIVIVATTFPPNTVAINFDFVDPFAAITPFNLVDDGLLSGEGFNQKSFEGLLAFGQYTVIEGDYYGGVLDIQCTEFGAVGTNTPTVIELGDIWAQTAQIQLDEGETVTCTFVNHYLGCQCPTGPVTGNPICEAQAECRPICNASGYCV